jgi:hypothetical protein
MHSSTGFIAGTLGNDTMASNTKQTKFRRQLTRSKMGRARKAALNANGTTPAFPVHTAEAQANAPKEQLPPEARGE